MWEKIPRHIQDRHLRIMMWTECFTLCVALLLCKSMICRENIMVNWLFLPLRPHREIFVLQIHWWSDIIIIWLWDTMPVRYCFSTKRANRWIRFPVYFRYCRKRVCRILPASVWSSKAMRLLFWVTLKVGKIRQVLQVFLSYGRVMEKYGLKRVLMIRSIP